MGFYSIRISSCTSFPAVARPDPSLSLSLCVAKHLYAWDAARLFFCEHCVCSTSPEYTIYKHTPQHNIITPCTQCRQIAEAPRTDYVQYCVSRVVVFREGAFSEKKNTTARIIILQTYIIYTQRRRRRIIWYNVFKCVSMGMGVYRPGQLMQWLQQ